MAGGGDSHVEASLEDVKEEVPLAGPPKLRDVHRLPNPPSFQNTLPYTHTAHNTQAE